MKCEMIFKKCGYLLIFSLISIVLVHNAGSARAAAGDGAPQPLQQEMVAPGPDQEQLEVKVAEVQARIESAQAAEKEETAQQLGVSMTQLQEHTAYLREIEAVYQQQLTSLKRQDSLNKEEASLDRELSSRQERLIAQPPPYTLTTYDGLLDQLSTVEKQEQTAEISLKSIKKRLEESKTKLEQAGHHVREAEEKLQKLSGEDNALLLSWSLDHEKVKKELAQASLDLQRMNVANGEAEMRLARMKKEITQRHVDWVRTRLAFDQDDLDKQLETWGERRAQLQARIDTLRQEQQEVEDIWLAAQQEFEAVQGAGEIEVARAAAYLKAREAWRETYQNVLEQSQSLLVFLNQAEQVWQRRYALLGENIDYQQLNNWQQETADQVKNIDRLVTVKENYQQKLQSEIADIHKRKAEEGLDAIQKGHLEAHEAALNKMAERNFEYLTLLQRAREIEQRFLDEISATQNNAAIKKKLKGLGAKIKELWEVELWVVDERSVTVKKVATALVILVLGMLLAGWLTRSVIRRILRRTRLDESATAAIEHVLYFFALLVLVVVALRSVNIPLTVFTFLGGAIAIGVGFGAQNLLNNFISGFILLAERPVKINDMIEVEKNFGIIEKIGMRCTRVRTPGNVHILVPNSSFLEKNIINWTLSDQEIRGSVTLGVVHGTDPKEASQLMLKAVHGHTKVLRAPEPVVLFDEVGDSSLKFIVYFWISMKSLHLLERRIIESDIRYRIMELFREAGIVVAYPQRDVHLDTSKPLELKLTAAHHGGYPSPHPGTGEQDGPKTQPLEC